MSTEPRYRVTSLDDIHDIPAAGGTLRWKPVRRTLGVQAFGVNAYAADAGHEVVETHDELSAGAGGHEELYVVLRGRARFTLDGEEVDAPAGTLVFARDPALKRGARATEDGTLLLAIGGDPESAYSVSAWESAFLAEGASVEGDHERAIDLMREALEEHEANPAVHYNLACFLIRAERHDEAIVALRRAYELDAAMVGRWASSDTDLDPLRERPDWPLE